VRPEPDHEAEFQAYVARARRTALELWRADRRRSAVPVLDDLIARTSARDAPWLTDVALQDLISCRWLRAWLAALDLQFGLAAWNLAAGWMCCLELYGRWGADDYAH
jgi:hypothetical protein